MNTLEIIQKLSKLGKILSKIMYIACIVGFILCGVSMISILLGIETFKLGGVSIHGIIETKMNTDVLMGYIVVGMIICIGKAIVAKYAFNYFKGELEDGTPFNIERSKELKRLGIITICIPIMSQIICEIVLKVFNISSNIPLDNNGSVSLGIMFIVMSIILLYGAEGIQKDTEY